MWSNWAENAKSSVTSALEKTGDALTKAATQAGQNARHKNTPHSDASPPFEDDEPSSTRGRYQQPQQEPTIATLPFTNTTNPPTEVLMNQLTQGWSSVVQSTQQNWKQAEEKIKQQQVKIQQNISRAKVVYYYQRDPSLPLDTEALRDTQVVYVTDRILTMGHPAMPSQTNGDISAERKLAAVGHLLHRRHAGHYMVWNLSEVEYNSELLDDQVLTYSFPGSPSPPLGLWLKLLVAMESWLKADARNVAVVHCLTGKGRTSLVVAAFLCWMGEAGFASNQSLQPTLQYIAQCKQMTPEELTIPSQRRYALYFKNMLDGIRPSQPPVLLKRIIFSQAPTFARGILRGDQDEEPQAIMGCVPYIQIFKAGELLHTAPASQPQHSAKEVPFCHGPNVRFDIDLMVQGDILVRARHLTSAKQRVSMFRLAFHTGYAPPNVMRLTQSQLDGACDDQGRFPKDFFVDLIFEPAKQAGQVLTEQETQQPIAQPMDNAAAVRASPDDTMLHRDSRFWDVIEARVKETKASNDTTDVGDDNDNKEWVGPTVGRRRNFAKSSDDKNDGDPATTPDEGAHNTFSIGGEMEFLPREEDEISATQPSPQEEPKKKDSLMEALMGALDDSGGNEEQEEIVFDSDGEASFKTTSDSGSAVVVKKPGEEEDDDKEEDAAAVNALMNAANLTLEDDIDALLAGATSGMDELTDDDLLNLDIEDPELDDLESFLSPSASK